MPRYKLTVAYDGTNFHGWQKQQRAPETPVEGVESVERIRTVQGVLEAAVRRVIGEPVNLLGASRTDAGVHARGQVAAFTAHASIPIERLARAISSRCPPDLQVVKAELVPDDFDPIKGAIAKGYRYRIVHGSRPGRRPVFDRFFVTTTAHRLNAEAMNEAARQLLGEHDFASFTRIAHGRDSTVRTIYNCSVTATRPRRLHVDVVGNGFLYNMVRIIAGTLLEEGRGRIEPMQIRQILEARTRDAAGPTLPPDGLCLMWIRYPDQQAASPA